MILTVTANPTIDKVYFVNELRPGEVHRPMRMTASAGGKGINVAKVAHTLGESVLAMGFVGGYTGRFVVEQVRTLGIETDFTEVAGETRVNVNISDASGRSTELLEAGPAVSAAERDAFYGQYEKQLGRADIVCLSGSLPKGLDGSFYAKLIAMAKAQGKRVIVDSVEDVRRCAPFMIKPNKDEIGDADIKKALLSMREQGIELPLTTMGKDGALALIDGQFVRFIPPAVAVKNAVGSGDSTVAGIAVGLCRGMSYADAVRLGMAAGVANTQFEQTGRVSVELIDRYIKLIQTEELV
jgi:tagatose 6-phosphate kinase